MVGRREKRGEKMPRALTYTDVGRHEPPHPVGLLEESGHAVEENKQHACHHAVTGLEPLRVGFVRIPRVVAVIARRRCSGIAPV